MEKTDFLLSGVGGQGVLTASDILAEVGMTIGLDAKKSEIHGFSQRGGVVESHVRWGPRVASPLGEKGKIDYLIAFELLESARSIAYLKEGGVAIVSRQRILPMAALVGDASYPSDEAVDEVLRSVTNKVIYVDGLEIATSLGSKNLANSVLLGALACELEIEPQIWIDILLRRVPAKYAEQNEKAFKAGMAATSARP
jgi:indolepyruvate ferredoxin oxidoreductase beta subunit